MKAKTKKLLVVGGGLAALAAVVALVARKKAPPFDAAPWRTAAANTTAVNNWKFDPTRPAES